MVTKSEPSITRSSAIAGAIAWLIVAFVRTSSLPETDLINKILLLGILVIIPLGLSLVATPDKSGRHSKWYRLAVYAQPVGAVAAVISLLLEQSVIAGVLASCWFVVTALIACFGLWRLVRRGLGPVEEFSIDAGLGFLSIGGGWFMLSRLGIQPLGFGDTIVLLTAVHFHFAGFAAPILAGLAGRMIGAQQAARKVFQVAVFGIILGVPLVAAGITASPILALVGAVTVSFGLFVLAFAVIGWIVPAVESMPARILLIISSASSCSAMVLASVYAYSIVSKRLIVDIPQMAMTHGIINAFGFALCGLVAWSLVKPIARAAGPE